MKRIILIALVGITSISRAQTLKELVNSSVKNYPKLKEMQVNILSAEESIALAKAGYQPNIAINGSYSYVGPVSAFTFSFPSIPGVGDLPPMTRQMMPHNNFNTNVGLQQTVWDFGRTDAQVQRAKQNKIQASDNLKAQELGLAYQVAILYNNIVLLNKNIDLQEQQIKFAQDNLNYIVSKIKNGDALAYDSLQADVRLKVEQNKKVDLINQLEKQQNLLRFYTASPEATVSASSFEGNAQNAEQLSLVSNTDVQLAKDKVALAEKDYKTSVANFLPNLNVNAQAGFKNGYIIGQNYDINRMYFNYVAGAGITIPLYDQGRAVAQRKIYKIAISAAQENLNYAKQNAQKDLEQAQADLNANQIRLANTRAIARQADAAFQLAQSRYKNGTITWLDLENSRVNVESAQFSLIQLEYQIILNNLEISRLAGDRFWEK